MKKMTYIIIGVVVIAIVFFMFLSREKCVSTFDPITRQQGGGCYHFWQSGWWRHSLKEEIKYR